MTLPRVITAVFLVPLVIGACWAGTLPYFFLISGIALLGAWEYSVMADQGGYPNQLMTCILGTFMVVMAFYLDGVPTWGPIHKSPSALFVFFVVVMVCFLAEFFKSDKSLSFLRVITTLSGVVICGLLLGHMILIRDLRVASGEGYRLVGRELMFFLIFLIWIVDTGAWFVGKTMGRFPMAPQISPKKTWVGFIGGVSFAVLFGSVYPAAVLKGDLSAREGVFISLFVAIVAQFSDLAESLMKRSFDVKDSSALLPGHGGVLDRFDAFIFASPVFYYLLLSTGRFQ